MDTRRTAAHGAAHGDNQSVISPPVYHNIHEAGQDDYDDDHLTCLSFWSGTIVSIYFFLQCPLSDCLVVLFHETFCSHFKSCSIDLKLKRISWI